MFTLTCILHLPDVCIDLFFSKCLSHKIGVQGSNQWYEMQDLHVSDILPQMITLSEAYIQIWALRQDEKKAEGSNGEPMAT